MEIYKQDPKAIVTSTVKSKAGKAKGVGKQENLTPRVKRLLEKLHKIESDILFDQRDADDEWALIKINWDKEAARQRKEEHLAKKQARAEQDESLAEDTQNDAEDVARQADEATAGLLDGDDDDDIGLLGKLFANLPQTEVDEATGASQMVTQDSSGVRMIIKDFGKWTGVGPRRVLEEACRARYNAVKYMAWSS